MPLPPELARLSVCDLETIGRVTGRRHVIEIWFAADPSADTLFLLAGGRERAHWVRNVGRDPAVRVRLGDRWYPGRAVVIGPDDPADGRARSLVAGKYQGWREGRPFSAWARDSLPVSIDLG
jgi:hypothetical protein